MVYDVAIIGGGPAGISAGIYCMRAGKSTIIFEGKELGGKLNEIDKIENYPGFVGSGKELAKNFEAHIQKFACEIKKKFVQNVIKLGAKFMISAGTDIYEAKKVIYCGGFKQNTYDFAKKYEGNGVSYCATCDGMFYRGKTVVLVGSGADAQEEAMFLGGLCKKVYVVSDKPIDISGENFEKFTPYKLVGIDGENIVSGVTLQRIDDKTTTHLDVDGVFLAIGGRAKNVLTDIKSEDFIKTDGGATEVKGLFVAGDIDDGNIKQVVVACASGANAAIKAIKELNSDNL